MTIKFVGGISDGAEVPEVLWMVGRVVIEQYLDTGDKIQYQYEENEEDKNWHLKGTEYVCDE